MTDAEHTIAQLEQRNAATASELRLARDREKALREQVAQLEADARVGTALSHNAATASEKALRERVSYLEVELDRYQVAALDEHGKAQRWESEVQEAEAQVAAAEADNERLRAALADAWDTALGIRAIYLKRACQNGHRPEPDDDIAVMLERMSKETAALSTNSNAASGGEQSGVLARNTAGTQSGIAHPRPAEEARVAALVGALLGCYWALQRLVGPSQHDEVGSAEAFGREALTLAREALAAAEPPRPRRNRASW